MAAVEDLFKSNLPIALGLGLTVALPAIFPSLRPRWSAAIKTGVKLYLEASGEAEVDLIDSLAEGALDQLAALIARPAEKLDDKVTHVVSAYKAKARARSHRWGFSEEDRRKRYDRHIAKLCDKISCRCDTAGDHGAVWDMALEKLPECPGDSHCPQAHPQRR
ncbi:MAG: hypothetical protein EKK29_10800 [Hyphomicrobiales bacterium]|nr:MAG: hypothetical protein EKK29_10800 [Hyphomicrobiales bacterium]